MVDCKHIIGNKTGHNRKGGRTERSAQGQSNRVDRAIRPLQGSEKRSGGKGATSVASWREDKRTAHQRGYTAKWQRTARAWLDDNPLCVFCERAGRTTAAMVVDHIRPHKGDAVLFWDCANLQSLCRQCHDSDKQLIENKGYVGTIGDDGWPVDHNHPVNVTMKKTYINPNKSKA